MTSQNSNQITKEQIARINELARKSKTIGLTDTEKAEQQKLRNAYRMAFRASLSANIDNIYVIGDDGEKVKYTDFKKDKNKG